MVNDASTMAGPSMAAPGRQGLLLVDRRGDEAAVEPRVATALGPRRARPSALVGRQEARLLHAADGVHPQPGDVEARLRVGHPFTVQAAVVLDEQLVQLRHPGLVEARPGQLDLQAGRLAAELEGGVAAELGRRGQAFLAQLGAELGLERGEVVVQHGRRDGQRIVARGDPGMDQVGRRDAEGGEDRRGGEDQDLAHPEVTRVADRVDGAGPTERVEHEVLRQAPAADHLAADEVGHVAVHDAHHARGRLDRREAQRAGQPLVDGRPRGRQVQATTAAQEVGGVDVAQDEVGVGDGRLGAARAVAHGARPGAGALGADDQPPRGALDAGDRPAAGADRGDVDDRLEDAEPLEDRARRRSASTRRSSTADVEARAAHVGRDDARVAQQGAHLGRREHAAGGARLEGRDGRRAVVAGQPAVALHDEDPAGEPVAPQLAAPGCPGSAGRSARRRRPRRRCWSGRTRRRPGSGGSRRCRRRARRDRAR